MSHRKKLSFGTFRKYEYDSNGGEGVDVYVVDTGINIDHEEFEGRASWGKTIPQNDQDIDGNGHGTHCAGSYARSDFLSALADMKHRNHRIAQVRCCQEGERYCCQGPRYQW